MKKTLIIAALAAVLVFAFAATAFAYGPIYSGNYNRGYDAVTGAENASTSPNQFTGYLSWSYVKTATGAIDSPHGNYTTTTNKCAVCHAVHRAKKGGVVLTAWGGKGSASPAFSSTMAPYESCFFCHGNGATFTNKTVEFYVTTTGVLSPHTTCGRCHTASPHGADGSEYPLLASKLLNDHADYQLHYDLVDGPDAPRNGLSVDMFDLSNPALKAQGMTLGTGYLCVGCHGSATNQHVFAVNQRGATPAIHYGTENPAGHAFSSGVTGHQVWIDASSDWFNPGAWYSGGGAHDYYLAEYVYDGVTYKVVDANTFQQLDGPGGNFVATVTAAELQALGWDSTIAFNNAKGCGACHDAIRTNGKLAFPHGYVTDSGAPAPKFSNRLDTGAAALWNGTTGVLQTSFLWLTKGANADAGKTNVYATGIAPGFTVQKVSINANMDGACLKCHVSGDELQGVGITY